MYSVLNEADATKAVTTGVWMGEAVAIDAWAWVHCVHFFFGLQTIFSLLVLCLVTYQKFRSGKIWIGDPFASISTENLVMHGILVFISWAIDSFWSINEYAMSRAAIITGSPAVRVHKEIMHADILVVFLSLVGFISSLFGERIDPAIVIFLVELVHKYRLVLLRSSTAVVNEVVEYSEAQYNIGIANVTAVIADMSPLRLWTSFQFPSKDSVFIIASFYPMVFLLVAVSLIAIVRKFYRFCYPQQIRQRSSQSTDRSGNEKTVMTLRGIITNFELATGAALKTRFGLVSDYDNYVYFKDMKFASADGVYCSGYVIVNGKFLVSSKDLVWITMIKLLRTRLANIYVYEVEGNAVKDTARVHVV
ncbi:unnamed protein product [Phytophthora fragariaefolia]|uniref:Unnamed protein product n=1 Tax=Phytophthora fragariaefolia TaxID=1490495 RepID=A0A9W6XR15_9STRA|nr:unnamed protein product [Phytophthora fragariaefolia]